MFIPWRHAQTTKEERDHSGPECCWRPRQETKTFHLVILPLGINCLALISRQFREMTRARIEGLIASFPKLTSSGQQHTTIETDHVRYVYQPLEELFIVLITNKQSNILQGSILPIGEFFYFLWSFFTGGEYTILIILHMPL